MSRKQKDVDYDELMLMFPGKRRHDLEAFNKKYQESCSK